MKLFAILLSFLSCTTIVKAQVMQQESECVRQHISRVNKAAEEFKIKNDNLDKQYDPLIDAAFKQNNDERFNALVKAKNDAYNIIHKEVNDKVVASHNEREKCLGNIQVQRVEAKRRAEDAERKKAEQEARNRAIEQRNREIEEHNRKVAAENARRRAEEAERRRKEAEARRQAQLDQRNKGIIAPAAGRIDNTAGSAKGVVDMNQELAEDVRNSDRLAQLAEQKKGNVRVAGIQMDPALMGIPKEEPAQVIGSYANKPVYKKGDTIIVVANSKKYLLSKQALMGGVSEVYAYTPENAFIISNDLQGVEMPIGYITTTSKKSNSTLYGEIERFAKSAVGCKFTEYICDKVTYDKFIRFCDWQICKMINSANNSMIISNDLESKKEEYAELYAIIASQKGKDIAVNIAMDAGDFLWNNKYAKKLKAGSVVSILGQNVSMNTSINEYASLLITDALTYPLSSDELKIGGFSFKDIKDCILQSNIINVKEGNLTLGELMKDSYRTEQTKKIEKELETEVAKYFKQGRDMIDKCIPADLKFKSKQAYLYYAIGKNLVEYGEMLGFMAASIKLTFFDNSSKKEYDVFIDNCLKKKVLLEEYKTKYYNLIRRNENNCLEYTKIINQLKSEIFNPFGDKNTQEVLTLMQDYVFGQKEVPKCDILSFNELRPTAKNAQPHLQPQQQSNNGKIADNYIAIALLDPDGANGLGHAGLILYDSSKGFLYYSHAPSNSPKLSKGINYLDCKTITNEVKNYSEAFYIPISYDTFKSMNGEAARSVNREYKVHALAKDSNMVFSAKEVISLQPIADKVEMGSASNNCLDLLINAFEAGGFNNGIIEARSTFDIPVPNIRFNLLKTKNAGKQIDINQLCNMIKISYQDNVQTQKNVSIPKRNH